MKKLLTLLLLLTAPAFADDNTPKVTFLSAKEIAAHQATINRLQGYLSNLTTVISDFTQTSPDGTVATGKFYLQRPGKMRWQYNPPTPILIVSSGKELVFYDYELEQVSYIPLNSTLIGFLAQDKISFETGVGISAFEEKTGIVRITLAEREKPDEGQLLLEFSDQPLQLRNMIITDPTHQTTSVSLNNAAFGTVLDKSLFIFRDPRKPRRKE